MRKLLIVVLLFAVVAPNRAIALGLGEIVLESALNEPLLAEIELLSPGELSAAEVIANLASDKEFQRSGIERFFYLSAIRFNTVTKNNGRLVIELTTREPIKEPFVNFLVELNWPAGKLVREYTLLLDPPIFTEEEIASSRQVAATGGQTVQDEDPLFDNIQESEGGNIVESSRTIPVIEFDDTQEVSVSQDTFDEPTIGPGELRVNEGETPYNIARNVKPRGATINQTIVAIYEANPNAFIDGNINLLKRGETIRIPDTDEILAQDRAQSAQFVTAQVRAFEESRGIQRISVAPDAEIADLGTGPASDRLKLLTPDGELTGDESSGGVGGSSAGLRRKLGAARETAEALKQENVELRDRLDALSQQVEKMQRLISLKDQELAALQLKLGDESPIIAEEGQFQVDEELVEAGQSIEMEGEGGDPLATPDSSPFKKKPRTFLDDLGVDGTSLMAIGGGAILLIAGILYYRKRRMAEDEFQDSLLAGEFDTDMTFGNDFQDVNDDVLDTSIGEEMTEEDIAEMDADPVSEADVYIAYGKFEQAEELLLSSLEDDPNQLDVRLKLFECYAEAKEQEKFQNHMDDCVNLMDSDSAFEQQVMGMFHQAWPDGATSESFDANEELPSTDDIFGEVEEFDSSPDVAETDELDEFASNDMNETVLSNIETPLENDDLNDIDASFDDGLDNEFSESVDTDLDDDFSADLDNLDDLDDLEFNLDEDIGSTVASNQPESSTIVAREITSDDDLDLDAGLDFAIDADDDLSMDLEVDAFLDEDHQKQPSAQESTASVEGLDDLDNLDDIDIDFEQDMLEQLGGDMDLAGDEYSLDNDETSIRQGVEAEVQHLTGSDDLDMDLDSLGAVLADVDEASTKLDLARAYIDMGDVGGARDILNEVMSEGNDSQKSEARALLEKI